MTKLHLWGMYVLIYAVFSAALLLNPGTVTNVVFGGLSTLAVLKVKAHYDRTRSAPPPVG